MSDDLRRMASGLPPKPPSGGGKMVPPGKRPKDYTPVEWDQYWDEKNELEIDGDRHSYYATGPEDSDCVLFLIHGGGFSGLSFSLFAKEISNMVNVRIRVPRTPRVWILTGTVRVFPVVSGDQILVR